MALATGLLAMNAFVAVTGVGLGITGIVLESELRKIQKQIDDLLLKNKDLIKASQQFQDTVDIMVSPILQNQQVKVEINLKSNIDQIQQYYKYLGKLMQGNDPKKFNPIILRLPGSGMASQSIKVTDITSMSLSIMYSLYSVKKTYKQYKKWKKTGKINPTKDYPLDDILPNPNSATSKGITKTVDAVQVTKDSANKNMIQTSLKPIKPNSAKNGPFVAKISSSLKGLSKKISNNIGNIGASMALIGGIVSTLSQISNIIKLTNSIETAKDQLNTLQAQLDQFFQACLGVLYRMQEFLANFETVMLNYVTFLHQITLISMHNVIALNQSQQKYSQNIADLDMSKYINSETFQQITKARAELKLVLSGLVIKETFEVVNGQKIARYSTSESHEQITKRFQQATAVFVDLDTKINFVLIYNQYYKRLLKAQIIIKDVKFEQVKLFAKFANQIKRAVSKKEPLQQIEELYTYEYEIEVQDFTQDDRYNIAQLISFFADTYPDDQPYVYTYKLVDFQMEFDADYKVDQQKQMHDVDMSDIMGTWPETQIPLSIAHINLHYKVNKEELKYLNSSTYVQQKGTLDEPSWELFRLQAFQKGKKETYAKYYVLYHGVTNNFEQIRLNKMKQL